MWKIQKLLEAHAVNCKPKERSRESLPKPPPGMAWLQNKDTREWKLVSEDALQGQQLVEAVTTESYNLAAAASTSSPLHNTKEHDDTNETVVDFAPSDVFENPFQHGMVVTSRPTSSLEGGESKSEEAEADWELLSEGHGSCTSGLAFVTRNGSISSHSVGHKKNLSSSTIDSHDHFDLLQLGPSGKGILGVDYVEHVILSTDTLQGICLAYKVSASRLKRANHFTGETLAVAPKKLVIPISKQAIRQGYLRVQDTDSKEYKLHAIQAELPMLGITEAKA
jgi:LysM repeat protein